MKRFKKIYNDFKVRKYIYYFEKFVQAKSWLNYKSYENYNKAVARAKRKCIKGIRDVLEG